MVTCKGDQEGVTQQGRRKTKRGLSPGSPEKKVNQDGGSSDLNDRVNSDLDQGRLHGVLGSEGAECNGFMRKRKKRNWKKQRQHFKELCCKGAWTAAGGKVVERICKDGRCESTSSRWQ